MSVLVDLGATPAGVAGIVGVPVQNPEPPPGQGEEFGKASPVALVVILLLAVATVLLVRSMSKRIRRLPASFDAPSSAPVADGQDAPAADGAERRDAEDAGGGRA